MTAVDRIKEICKERNIPISRLERECGFANAYIRGLKEGKMPADRLYKVADFLNVSPEYLLTGKDSPKESQSGKTYYFSDETAETAQEILEDRNLRMLFDAAKGSKPEDLQMVADMLRRFKETNPDG